MCFHDFQVSQVFIKSMKSPLYHKQRICELQEIITDGGPGGHKVVIKAMAGGSINKILIFFNRFFDFNRLISCTIKIFVIIVQLTKLRILMKAKQTFARPTILFSGMKEKESCTNHNNSYFVPAPDFAATSVTVCLVPA